MNLHEQSNDAILANVERLIKTERTCTAKLIAHLAEIHRRRLHLKLGFCSMFEYCTKHLLLDSGQVWLRLQVARKCHEFPRLFNELADGTLSLTVCGQLAAHLTLANYDRLLSDCRGMSRREVESYLVGLKPKPEKSASIRAAAERHPPVASLHTDPKESLHTDPKDLPVPPAANTTDRTIPATQDHPRPQPARMQPATPQRYNISLSVDKSVKAKLERLAEVLGKTSLRNSLEEVLDYALESGLEKKDPIRKAKRAERRKVRREQAAATKTKQGPTDAKVSTSDVTPSRPAQTQNIARAIPAARRMQVMKRAGYRCEYVGAFGQRCSARTRLQLDHLRPYGMGGDHSLDNLRVVCCAHNLAKAVSDYGEVFMATKISSSGRGLEHR